MSNYILRINLELKLRFLFRDKTVKNCCFFRYNVKMQTNEFTSFCHELQNKTKQVDRKNNDPGCFDDGEKHLLRDT